MTSANIQLLWVCCSVVCKQLPETAKLNKVQVIDVPRPAVSVTALAMHDIDDFTCWHSTAQILPPLQAFLNRIEYLIRNYCRPPKSKQQQKQQQAFRNPHVTATKSKTTYTVYLAKLY